MSSMTGTLLRQRKLERRGKSAYKSKKIETSILLELKEKLADLLKDNDSVMLEINPSVVSEFLNILDDVVYLYDYKQVDETKFIFYNKELEI